MSDWTKIHAFADGQLSPAETQEVAAWIKDDPKAQAELEAIEALKSTVSTRCETMTCEETWKKCQGRLRELDRKSGVEAFVGKWAWGLCSIFIVAIASAAYMNRIGGPQIRSTDLMSASMPTFSAPQSKSQTEQRRWLRGLSIPVEPGPVQVESAYEGVMNGRRVVRLNLTDNTGPMSLFMASCDEFTDRPVSNEYGIVRVNMDALGLTWSQKGMSFLLIGKRDPEALQAVAEAIRKQ